MNEEFIHELEQVVPVRRDEPLARHTTFGVGGPADVYLAAKTEDQLREAFAWAHRHKVPVFILGSGSNILVGDRGVRGLVIENRTDRIEGPSPNGTALRVRSSSGLSLASLARRLSSAGYQGVEWAVGIPGSLGGAVVSNAGAHGSSLSDVLKGIRVADTDGNITEMGAEELALGYRRSAFSQGGLSDRVILSVDIKVDHGEGETIAERVRTLDEQRKAAQPPGRNCGSAFKNPEEHPAWWLVDQVGLRGHRIGNAQISEQHTNFILNLGGATAAEVVALMDLARSRVRERFGIELEAEVALVGEFE
jgi:UDP-N-acetylmuramate dehydrogenase